MSRVTVFRCTKCGQRLKVPRELRGEPDPPGQGAPSRTVSSGGRAPAPPRRRSRPTLTTGDGAPSGAPARGAAAAPPPTAAMPAPPPPAPSPAKPAPVGRRTPPKKPARHALPLPVRLAAWAFAIPVGLILVGYPARKLGYLTGQKLLDVIVKHNLDRFVPLLVIVALWALATALLVEVFIEGGRWVIMRRRQRAAAGVGGLPGSNGLGPGGGGGAPAPAPPSRRQRRSVAARRGS